MARNSADLTSCKRDAKLEIFLKQKLGENVYERIQAYEACIAQSRKVKRNFKFVVLSDEKIYITDNPPKAIKDEESVNLGDVTSIHLVRFPFPFSPWAGTVCGRCVGGQEVETKRMLVHFIAVVQ